MIGGIAIALVLILSNVVAAGVLLALGMLFKAICPDSSALWPWFVIGIIAVITAVLFIVGAIQCIQRVGDIYGNCAKRQATRIIRQRRG